MEKNELIMVGFEIVAYAGDARSSLLELLKEVRKGNFENVDERLQEADENLNLAHQAQTKILAEEAAGQEMELGFIFIHSQDHLMTTILLRDIVTDFIELYKQKEEK
ncbi:MULTISPECIES: PTS lactose/cellobiose transporter subunit IIA [unclassified Breznakia]|uniref:PTS lactose/cellobiose transporter subunit IIA n=1 Tax=unclassified Breznakia TaxID=2623764 RepID=UPI002474335E|nr:MULTISPECIES: PTS lactose/cellobiose transporter subunit IIA [unclassified Breznakia]MDH6366946.1 PTS system lactose-specific IIA component [Breznakia sp. PH1-1]MDH6404124.1 PTS system lactose-specific IIA component [Breznakia sp. PF1-11]MDH6411833.1 PTS system lactose-specific IIA component [Breznakia sp. PFB1-11]MDH6414112.1 PTS system lactose-specific IIA component [Breznakia sp. PFB1-14]MDH6416531.1 PTS system lactose-specific IIA component [Breznakia sp. PFB1-4]